MFALGQVLENRRAAAEALQRDVAKRSAEARTVAGERQRLVDAVEGGTYLQARRNARPSVVELADELARRLPDGTYLEKLRVFFGLREVPGLKKKPSTSELIDWLKLLVAEDIPPEALRSQDGKVVVPPLHGALLKNEQDMHLFERLVFMSRHNR